MKTAALRPLGMLSIVLGLTPMSAQTANGAPAVVSSPESAVVKIFSTQRMPLPGQPWTKAGPTEVSGSGVVIEGKRILTNAHVVQYASQIQVQANQASDKMAARVVAIAPSMDLALLELDDSSFFAAHPSLPRANVLPAARDEVLAYGFPVGGASLSITKGIVSRIEFAPYTFSSAGLRIQVDAAINPGNSGGPVVAGGKMIGLAFLGLMFSQNISYIIPNEEIELFLQDVSDGRYDGKPAMFDELQTLENPALRAFLKLDASVVGSVVQAPLKSDAEYPLKKWDVITRIADSPIDNEGMVKLGNNLRVRFPYMVQKVARDGSVPLTVVRAGKTLTIKLPVLRERPRLIPDLNGTYPPYFIYGPLVFTRASPQLMQSLGNAAMGMMAFTHSPLIARLMDAPDGAHDELVVIAAPFFSHRLAKGYSNRAGAVVSSVNGVAIKSMQHLVAVLRDLKDEFVVFEFDQRGGETLVFPRAEMLAATEEILADNSVRTQGSPDMMEVWRGKTGN